MKSILSLFVTLLLIVKVAVSQELPPIQIFSPQDYGAEDQNWAISQDEDGFIYIANNEGLLEFNGAKWQLYDSPNKSIIRSVNVINDKIYTGCYMNFGFWSRSNNGNLEYTSLSDQSTIELKDDEEFWNIIEYDNYILFQSLDRIYIYNTSNQGLSVIESTTRITKAYKVDDLIYFQKLNQGIFKIENGKEVLLTQAKELIDNIVINIFSFDNGLLFYTKENGAFYFENNKISIWNDELNSILIQNSLYTSIRLKDGSYILGTVSNGVMNLDNLGNLKFMLNQSNGMSNNTVLSILEDKVGNIWLGLDNGVNVLNLKSPFKVYNDSLGDLGTIYTSAIYNDFLYLGTNQGLFSKPLNSNASFTLIPQTNGQVWSLDIINDGLFCSHDKGTFTITKDSATHIFSDEGTWTVKEVKGNQNLLIQGSYDGLYILEKTSFTPWKLRNKIEGFDISSRYFEFLDDETIFVSHEHKGVYKLKVKNNFNNLESYAKDSVVPNGIKSGLFTYQNKLFYAFVEGVFNYNIEENKFVKDSVFSSFYNSDTYVSGKFINEVNSNRLWCFTENALSYTQPAKLASDLKTYNLAFPNEVRKTKAGYENILAYSKNKYIIGTTKGYIVMDLDKVSNLEYKLKLNHVINYKLNDIQNYLNINNDTVLKTNSNNVKFEYSVSNYDRFLPTKYSYRLLGFNDEWSSWSKDSYALYENLPHGEFTLQVKSKVGDTPTFNTIFFNFKIEKPWNLSTLAIIIYVFGLIILIFLTHNIYKHYYKRQRQKLLEHKEREIEFKELENQKQLIQFKNKNLQQDVDNKNRELGISTMNLIKKNELLSSIKKEIANANQIGQLKNVIKLINKNINATDDWKLFEEAFNNADKDFLKEIKSKHPSLTSNDLRLCAYLRLNLSSKEIAPLLNISPRSVEVKRYRLRKKMDLTHDDSLTNYILSI